MCDSWETNEEANIFSRGWWNTKISNKMGGEVREIMNFVNWLSRFILKFTCTPLAFTT